MGGHEQDVWAAARALLLNRAAILRHGAQMIKESGSEENAKEAMMAAAAVEAAAGELGKEAALSQRLKNAGRRYGAARDRERAAAAELYEAIREAIAEGLSEVEVAKLAGVNRLTVRRALGKE